MALMTVVSMMQCSFPSVKGGRTKSGTVWMSAPKESGLTKDALVGEDLGKTL